MNRIEQLHFILLGTESRPDSVESKRSSKFTNKLDFNLNSKLLM
jgi:hypothetical protein